MPADVPATGEVVRFINTKSPKAWDLLRWRLISRRVVQRRGAQDDSFLEVDDSGGKLSCGSQSYSEENEGFL